MLTGLAAQPRALAWHPGDLEARLLAELLRLSRVTVLYGAAGAGKTTLLKTGILPLLCRRHEDRDAAGAAHTRTVVPFPERRRAGGGRGEVAVYFDAWDEDPLARLQEALLESLPPVARHAGPPSSSFSRNLAIWHDELGLRFFIVLDAFEHYLQAPEDDSRILDFARELLRVLNDAIPVNFLIALRDDAQPLLEEFRSRIPGFDDASFRLPALPQGVAADSLHAEAHEASGADRRAGTFDLLGGRLSGPAAAHAPDASASPRTESNAPSAPLVAPVRDDAGAAPSTDDAHAVARSLEAVPRKSDRPDWTEEPAAELSHAAADSSTHERGEQSARAADGDADAWQAAASSASARPLHAVSEPASPSSGVPIHKAPARKALAALALAAALVLGVWMLIGQVPDEPSAPSLAASTPALPTPEAQIPAPAALPTLRPSLPQVALVTEPGNSTDAVIAADIARTIAPDAGIEVVVQNDGVFWRHESMPRLALVRYETLEARRGARPDVSAGALDRVRVIAPLYTEEIHFIVRRDSPLQYIHEIRDARINVGPPQSARDITAARLYRGMFGVAQPPESTTAYDDDEALRKLLDNSIDVMMVVAAQPAKWLLDLPPESTRSLRLLKLEPSHGLTQNAIQYYLPAIVLASSYRTWLAEDTNTLATMAFLVTPSDREPAFAERLETVARALCRKLPELRRTGHPKWIEVEPTLEVDAGWPYSGPARAAFQSCLPERAADAAVVRGR